MRWGPARVFTALRPEVHCDFAICGDPSCRCRGNSPDAPRLGRHHGKPRASPVVPTRGDAQYQNIWRLRLCPDASGSPWDEDRVPPRAQRRCRRPTLLSDHEREPRSAVFDRGWPQNLQHCAGSRMSGASEPFLPQARPWKYGKDADGVCRWAACRRLPARMCVRTQDDGNHRTPAPHPDKTADDSHLTTARGCAHSAEDIR